MEGKIAIHNDINLNTQNKNKNTLNRQPFKDKFKKFLESRYYKIFYSILTIYVLFMDDIKMLIFDKSADLIFSIIAIVILVILLMEIIFYFLISDEHYLCSIFFVIDFFGLISMTMDIHFVTEYFPFFALTGNHGVFRKTIGFYRLTRGIRIVMRAIRMIRILKLLRLFKRSNKIEEGLELNPIDNEESKVGQKLDELTLKRMIKLSLLMILATIFFNPSFYYNHKTKMDLGISLFNDIPQNSKLFNLTFNVFITESINSDVPMLYLKAYEMEWGNKTLANELRPQQKIEVKEICFNKSDNNKEYSNLILNNLCIAIYDNKIPFRFVCIMSIIKTIFLCIVLGCGVIFFSKDTNELVLEPISNMTNKIKNLGKNPIEAMQNNLNEEENESRNEVATLETSILEKTISKISSLLALGFGEAGTEIISKNMQSGGEGDVNPMVVGRKVMAIYGFCDIRNFTDTTEVLQEKVMIFVNEIAQIVHEITSQYNGSANKNIGDAFLLVWKFDEKFVENKNNQLSLIKNKITSQIVNMSLIAFLKILAAVQKSYKLNQYRSHPGLIERINNYCVKMGFGLHLGYSIEGAIGSMFKIDASYLSPNVNMASKLEEKTKQYKVQLILSEEFVDYLSDDAKKFIRMIDSMKNKENKITKLYTIDFDLTNLPIDEPDNESSVTQEEDLNKKMEKIKMNRLQRKKLYSLTINGEIDIWNDFVTNDPDFIIMRKKFIPEFYQFYNMAIDCFEKGKWIKSKEYFIMADNLVNNNDGPISNYLTYMQDRNFNVDANWSGHKEEENDGH